MNRKLNDGMIIDPKIKRIKIQGRYSSRRVVCPYCRHICKVTLVTHLKRYHPSEWRKWTDEFVKIYNETNDLKRVMRVFTNYDGQPILSWTVIDREVRGKLEMEGAKLRYMRSEEHTSELQSLTNLV